ncbi:NAD(P)H-dependent oxidoreductase [bacterium]|nr:MAG: NAD(P)H-dependent oxidoreductase [bacterium]
MTLLAISGSLRAVSSNSVLLRAARALAPESVEVRLYEEMGELPHFNPEIEASDDVANLKRAVVEADGVLFCTPEYVHGLPGSFKNLLDWLVSDGELWDKPVAVLSARKSEFAEPQLREILRTLMAPLCEEASITVPFPTNKISEAEVLDTPELADPLRVAVKDFALFIETGPPARLSL